MELALISANLSVLQMDSCDKVHLCVASLSLFLSLYLAIIFRPTLPTLPLHGVAPHRYIHSPNAAGARSYAS